jgi:hypothetical protein
MYEILKRLLRTVDFLVNLLKKIKNEVFNYNYGLKKDKN